MSKLKPIHPGIYIRESVIPAEISITKAAAMLGVGRPALSNLLNGKAALSPNMAIKIEKAFQANASKLLDLQAKYKEHQTRTLEDDITVRPYTRAYRQIKTIQISTWADTIDARAQLPALLRMLINSTGQKLTRVDFPAFDNSQRIGWDGWVMSESVTQWIPRGKSGWELGCGKNPKKKAQKDYRDRTLKVPKEERRNTAFVFVTPRNWSNKSKTDWVKDKKSGKEWKDVSVLDANDLEQWLEQSIPAQIRMWEFLGYVKQTTLTLSQVWLEWAEVTEPTLPKKLFYPASDQYQEPIKEWLDRPPSAPLVVAAESTLEALAFLSCALERLPEPYLNTFDRSIVIRSLEDFNTISQTMTDLVAIVDSIEVEKALAGFQKRNHTIIVRDSNSVMQKADIKLNLLSYEQYCYAFNHSGLKDIDIKRLARESMGSLTILRRRLATIEAVKFPPWADNYDIKRMLVPFISIGAWDSNIDADREILKYLTDKSYECVDQIMVDLLSLEESPVWKIKDIQGVVSKIDALFSVQSAFTEKDLKNFLFVAELVLSDNDPAFELPQYQRWAAELYGKSREHSSVLRHGICDSLVLFAVHGIRLFEERSEVKIEAKVSQVVRNLLTPSTESNWLSQKNELPQYAEAAPQIYLEVINDDLSSENPQIKALFKSTDSGIFGECLRSGLLWSLELLAWNPNQLIRVTSILAELCAWKIDDNWANSPINSLKSIFRSWMPQTAASFDQRCQALENLIEKYPNIGWQICVDQFNPSSRRGETSVKPRWRADAHNAGKTDFGPDAKNFQLKAISLALDWSAHDEHSLGDLVECIDALSLKHQKRLWELISIWNKSEAADSQKVELRDRIRLYQHHITSNKGSKLARRTFELLKPADLVAQHEWLFENRWAVLWGNDGVDIDRSLHKINHLRLKVLREVLEKVGINGIKRLCQTAEASDIVGSCMAKIFLGNQRAKEFIQEILVESSETFHQSFGQCISSFLKSLESRKRDTVLADLLRHKGLDDESRIRLLFHAPFESGVWQQIDQYCGHLRERYWKEVIPNKFDHEPSAVVIIVDEMLKAGRPLVAFDIVQIYWERIDSSRVIRLLDQIAQYSNKNLAYEVDSYYLSEALGQLQCRGDVSQESLARLELQYIEVLYRSDHGIPNLEKWLSESPELFIWALSLAFKRNDGKEDPADLKRSNMGIRMVQAAVSLLTQAKRVPGTMKDGSIDQKQLRSWLKEVRILTRQYGRFEIGDQMVGQLLAHCPTGDDGIWPCEPVRETLEEIRSQHIAIGMNVAIKNLRGAKWKSEIETEAREWVEQYRSWSRQVAFKYPFVANMLNRIAESFDDDVRWWDNQDRIEQRLRN